MKAKGGTEARKQVFIWAIGYLFWHLGNAKQTNVFLRRFPKFTNLLSLESHCNRCSDDLVFNFPPLEMPTDENGTPLGFGFGGESCKS